MTPCTIVRPQKNVLSPNTQKAKYVFLFTELNSIKNVIMLKKLRDHFNTLVCYLVKKFENFGGHLLSEDDHSYWAPPYWNITKETFTLGRTEL